MNSDIPVYANVVLSIRNSTLYNCKGKKKKNILYI